MKITEEQKKEIIKKIGQEEFDKIMSKPSEQFIYAFKGSGGYFYKAHRVANVKYAFISLDDSRYFANGIHSSLSSLLESIQYECSVFQTQKDFIKWLIDNS